ncbi:hypothetical protein ACWEQ7_23430 [Streptomyces sp. NPDC004069]
MVLTSLLTRRPRVLLVKGGAGAGKSALLGAVARQAHTVGARVLTLPALWADARQLTGTEPTLLCVDDVHRAGPRTLSHLRCLARHTQPVPLVMVVTAPSYGARWEELFTEQVLRRPYVHSVHLKLLGAADVERTLADRGLVSGPKLPTAAARLHRLSGGSPLLLRALLAEDATFRQPSCDGPFARAVTDCLRRSGLEAMSTAHALAVLGGRPGGGSCLDALVEGGVSSALAGLAVLCVCGFLDGLGRGGRWCVLLSWPSSV